MTTSALKRALQAAAIMLLIYGVHARAAVSGRALLTDAPSRVKPGNLVLCTIRGGEKKFETLVTGNVIDAHFSPDGKQAVYGMDGMVRIIDLETRASRELAPYTAEFTYFNWCLDNKIYWSDGKECREIACTDVTTREKKTAFKAGSDRSTMSLDGKGIAWVKPPVCALAGENGLKQFLYMGGCGGAISPSGKFLTSNLTTTHKLMGIFSLNEQGPSAKPVALVTAQLNHAINGFSFGRSDDWVCYTVEEPKPISPIAYICYWRTDEHIEIGPKYVIKDYFDETNLIPADAQLERITVCAEGPTNTPLTKELANVGMARSIKVVGHYTSKGVQLTPQLSEGVSFKVNASQLAVTAQSYTGVSEAGQVTVAAEYKGKTYSFEVTVLPALSGDGFKAEYFQDAAFSKSVLTRVDRLIDFHWDGHLAPDSSINGKTPWSVQWTGMLNIQTDGEYTFYFRQGEGNDGFTKGTGEEKRRCYSVTINSKPLFEQAKGNYPWVKPCASAPVTLKKGLHPIKVTTIDVSVHPVVAQLFWSGPGIKQSLLGSPYIHSQATQPPKGR